MKRSLFGVIGHVDHGKTTLVRALTGMETDRLSEEKSRGISIALGFAHFRPREDIEIDLVDMPGHERFVRTMVAGAAGIDAILLVVAANEGIMPQTLEHLDIAAQLGLRRGVIALTKCDLVGDRKDVGALARDVVALVASRGIEAGAPVPVMAGDDRGVVRLAAELAKFVAEPDEVEPDTFACLPIDRAFSMPGHGPVVTGTLRGCSVSAGDTLELWPAGRAVRVRAVQVHGAKVDAAQPGQRAAINLRDVQLSGLSRGMRLATPGSLALSGWLTISVSTLETAPALRNGMRLRALAGTDEWDVRLRLLERDVLEPGESGFAQLHCERPVTLFARERVILRIASPVQTVAGGTVLEPVARRKRRNDPPVLERLACLAGLPPHRLVVPELERQPAGSVTLRDLSRLTGLSIVRIEDMLAGLRYALTREGRVIAEADIERVRGEIMRELEAQREGLSRNQLRTALPGTRSALLDEVLARMRREDVLTVRGGLIRLPRPEDDAAETTNAETLAMRIAEDMRAAGLRPPNPGALLAAADARRAADRLQRRGILVRCVDHAKGRELLFHKDAIDEAQRRLQPVLAKGEGMLVTEIASTLGVSRKFAMPLLDHLDAIRFTRRKGDRRYLCRK